MKNRYRITMTYSDESCITEWADDIEDVLAVLSWYLEDKNIIMADVYNKLEQRYIFSWAR